MFTFINNITKHRSDIVWGVLGSIGILLIFYLVQTIGMQSLTGPYYFMLSKWYFVLPLVVGFGMQLGIYRAIHLKSKQGMSTIAASGGVSTTAMIACCLHNFTLLLPILGLSGVAVFFSTYQDYVFLFSIVFVIMGIVYMIRKYKQIHACHQEEQQL